MTKKVHGKGYLNQISIDPSPLRPQTTIAIENVKIAANEAHAKVNSILKIFFSIIQ